MKKTTIERKVVIDAPKEKVWEAIADLGNVQVLSPNIKKSYLTSEQKHGVGTTRHCDFESMGVHVEERITEWNEGEYMKIDIYETNMPMTAGMHAEFNVHEENGSTSVIGKFEYGMSNAFGNLLNNLSMKKMNEKTWEKFLAGIKHRLETGEAVDKKTPLNTSGIETM